MSEYRYKLVLCYDMSSVGVKRTVKEVWGKMHLLSLLCLRTFSNEMHVVRIGIANVFYLTPL